jgi:hypothetical protein
MIENNLKDMIQPKPNDAIYKKIDLDNSKPGPMATGTITPEATPPMVKLMETLTQRNYQPKTEQALIEYVINQNNRLEVGTIFIKWEIGRSIKSFYQGKYGARELDKIVEATGIRKDSLNKMIKFAGQYTLEQLKSLVKGNFAVSWNGIAQNLAIGAETLIKVYEKAGNVNEFNRELIKSKDPGETRGKSKFPSLEAKAMDVEMPDQSDAASTEITVTMIPEKVIENSVIAAPEIISDESIPAEYNRGKKVSDDQIDQNYDKYSKELESLRLENQQLKEENAKAKRKIDGLSSIIDKYCIVLDERDQTIEAYRERFKRLRYAIEDGYSASDIMELLAAVE